MRVLGIKSDIFNYLSIILPVIDLIVIIVCGISSDNPILTVPMNLVFPIVGVSSLKIAEKIEQKWPVSVGMLLLSFYGGLFTYVSGLNSPGWIVAITYVPAVIFLFNSKLQQFIYLLILAIGILVIEISLGNTYVNIVTIIGVMLCFTLLIERSVAFLISQQSKILSQKNEIEEKNYEIFESLTYAQRIQSSLLPKLDNSFKNLEIELFYKPKDIVSGDFYWKYESEESIYFAVCDSTGHGVPGAMMSVLNINLLNEAINSKQLSKTGEIFDFVRSKLVQQLDQNEQKDGFDGVIICLDKNSKKINYTGANNQFIVIRDNELIVSEKDRMPVGKTEKEIAFNTFQMPLFQGDIIYMFTDGYPDQFGGEKGKKLKSKSFHQLILSNNNKPFLSFMQSFLDQWKGQLEQVDDICVCKITVL